MSNSNDKEKTTFHIETFSTGTNATKDYDMSKIVINGAKVEQNNSKKEEWLFDNRNHWTHSGYFSILYSGSINTFYLQPF